MSGQSRGAWARVRRAAAELTPDAIEQIAQRVAELLRHGGAEPEAPASTPQLVSAAQLARRLGVTRAWVYEHASELGAVALGDGPKARLRFDPAVAEAVLQARRRGRAPELPEPAPAPQGRGPGRPRRRRTPTVALMQVDEPSVRPVRRLSRSLLARRRHD
jgi:hypothetical protein